MDAKKNAYLLLREAGIGVALIIICVVFAATTPHFASYANLTNILTQISINTVISVGMTFVILLGGIDLSVGSVLALATIVAGLILTNEVLPVGLTVFLSVLASIVAGGLCGIHQKQPKQGGKAQGKWPYPDTGMSSPIEDVGNDQRILTFHLPAN